MASKRRLRRNACGSKRKFEREQDALTAALMVKRKTGDSGFVRAYRCKFCNKFHWGHT